MIPLQNSQASQQRVIERLASESHIPIDEAAHLYKDEIAGLSVSASIKSFVPIFALRNVQ